jgi:hypothetical protein
VSVDVILETQEAAAIAPIGAIFRDSPKDRPYVFVQQADGWERREVELGLASALDVIVRSGLRPGEIIAQDRPPTGPPKS